MNDIKPRPRKSSPAQSTNYPIVEIASPVSAEDLQIEPSPPVNNSRKKIIIWAIAVAVAFAISLLGGVIWYSMNIQAKGGSLRQLTLVRIEPGDNQGQIGYLLQEKSIIKSSFAFNIYTRLSGTHNKLQAGTYRLSPAETIPQIVEHLVNGTVDEFSITFYPGATLKDNRQVLIDAGFSAKDVDVALTRHYDSSLFDNKPTGTDLEGYIYGETYNFNSGATVEDILKRTFTQFENVINDNNLKSGFANHGLNLYQGITLASIIQREASSATDRKQIAQVFYTRLALDMPLESDVTFIYAANRLGEVPVSTLDSPYNTRIYKGLPPGPISSPSLTALLALVNPAKGDYIYFVAGDNGKVYFSRTLEEHNTNVSKYCTSECNKP